MYLKYIGFLLALIVFQSKYDFAKSTPVIVIAPSKKPQSISTVGSSVSILDENFFKNSKEIFLGDILSSNSNSINFFQNGGHGTSSAIQLRGLPKRYTTVYIDGVKMSDPSSVSNDFDFNHILTSQISRVEILRGNQSSVYGSGAIGGTINIFTKRPEKGFNKDFLYRTGSNGLQNFAGSLSGSDIKNSFYFGLERLHTDGISAMMHNNEKDRYRNNSLVGKYDYKFTNNLKFNSNLRFTDTYLQYDKVIDTISTTHDEEVDETQASYNTNIIYDINEKFSNNFSFANTYIKRVYAATENSGNPQQDNYYGNRYAISYIGNYNINLDNSVVFGVEKEEDRMGYNEDLTGQINKSNNVISKYYDYQSRITNNTYFTFGSRFDEHSIAGNEDSHRATFAYLFDDKTLKIKSSYGTGFRFPSLYEMFFVYAANSKSLGNVKAENSKSFDIGFEKFFTNSNFELSATYFNLEYNDVLEGWKTGQSSGSAYTTQNMPGNVRSEGLEFISKWIPSNLFNIGINYTYTSTYDGAEQDDPDKNSSYTNSQIVRVPRHLVNIKTNFALPNYEKLDFTLNTKWSDMARDYGNGNRTFNDEKIDDYLVNDLLITCKLCDQYNFHLKITNLLDEKYETSKDYSQLGRSLNIGFNWSF